MTTPYRSASARAVRSSTEPDRARHTTEPGTGSPPSAPPDTNPATPPRLHTPAAAAELLSVPESWLRRKAGHRLIPCTFLGKHLRFSDTDLAAIIENGTQSDRTPRHRSTHHSRRR
jgi:hypothetical protein